MSAYVCTPEHIALLAAYDTDDQEEAAKRASILAKENIRSVCNRYSSDKPSSYGKLLTKSRALAKHYADCRVARRPLEVLKLARCLEYQSCETSDYENTEAYKLIQRIKDDAIVRLDGYADAPWAI